MTHMNGCNEVESAHEKAKIFQDMLLRALDDYLPEKSRTISSDDQPWMTSKLKKMDRQRKRTYHSERRSKKWKHLNKLFKQEVKIAKI